MLMPNAPAPTPPSLSPAERNARLSFTFGVLGFLFPLAFASIIVGIRALRQASGSSNPTGLKRRAFAGMSLAGLWLAATLLGLRLILPVVAPNFPPARVGDLPRYRADSEHVAAMIRQLVERQAPMIAEFNQGLVNTQGMTHKARVVSVEANGERSYRASVSLISRQDSGWGASFDLTVRVSFNAGEEQRGALNVARSGDESWWLVSTYTDKVEAFKGQPINPTKPKGP